MAAEESVRSGAISAHHPPRCTPLTPPTQAATAVPAGGGEYDPTADGLRPDFVLTDFSKVRPGAGAQRASGSTLSVPRAQLKG